MVKKFSVAFAMLTILLFLGGNVTAQESVSAQEFIETLKSLIDATIKSTENSWGKITQVEMQIGVTYTIDSAGKLKIIAVPHDENLANATVHRVILHWTPQGNVQGPQIGLSGPMPMPVPGGGMSTKQLEAIRDMLQKRAKPPAEAASEEKHDNEPKNP